MDTTNEELNSRLEALESFVASLKSAADLPFEVDSAFRERLADLVAVRLAVSSKSLNSEDVSINEGGVATHVVLDDPDGWAAITLEDGTEVAVPYYTV